MNQAQARSEPPLPRLAFVSGLGFGGATTFVCNLAGELARRRVPVVVVSPEKENAFASDFERAGVRVFLHDDQRMIYEDRMSAMLRIIAAFQPTAVIGCIGPVSYEVLRYVPRGIHRAAIVQTDHAIHYDTAVAYAGCMDTIVGISSKIAAHLTDMDVFRNVSKLCLLHGVAIPPAVTPRGKDGGPLRILYLGRIMNPQKRVLLFPGILDALKKSGIPFQWTIAGEGDQRANLERLMTSDNPNQKITFLNSLPNAQVPALLEQHDIFLLASDAEGLPISLLEAMAHGLAPVVSDLESGIRDVVDADNGILVRMDDVDGYARGIIHLHEHRAELAAKSAAAHERVKTKFSVAAMADRWLAAFPASSMAPDAWLTRWNIKTPLVAPHPAYFWPPLRFLRRIAAKYR